MIIAKPSLELWWVFGRNECSESSCFLECWLTCDKANKVKIGYLRYDAQITNGECMGKWIGLPFWRILALGQMSIELRGLLNQTGRRCLRERLMMSRDKSKIAL